MYPTQTSLIPVGVALAKFLGSRGVAAFSLNYPYWYLGTTPFRFLTGPVLPALTVLIKYLASGLSYFDITISLVIISCLTGAAGWSLFVLKLSGQKIKHSSFVLPFLLFIILPWKYLNGLALSEPSAFTAEMFMPYVLLANLKNRYWGIAAATVVLLISTNVLPLLAVGLATLGLSGAFKDGRLRKWQKPLKESLIILGSGILLSTFYYSPGFWWAVLINPSIGGVPGIKAIFSLLGLARNSIPVFLAFAVVYLTKRILGRLNFFGWTWILVFTFLTLWRAFGNVSFWMDWISWFGALEIGIGILISANIKNLKYLLILFLPYLASFMIFKNLGSPKLVDDRIPASLDSLTKLSDLAGKNLVFTSGIGVFWLNAINDSPQVRGGRDEVSVDPRWLKASYVFREGTDPAEISSNLTNLEVTYILVNSNASRAYYHDFKNLEIWDNFLKVKWSGAGDTIYSF